MEISIDINEHHLIFSTEEVINQSGLYLVIAHTDHGHKKLYIGQAEDILDRLDNHDPKQRACWQRHADKFNGLIEYLAHPYDGTKLERIRLETKIIRKYSPLCNKQPQSISFSNLYPRTVTRTRIQRT